MLISRVLRELPLVTLAWRRALARGIGKLAVVGETARGLFGETWLLSARTPTPLLAERAQQARIRLLGPVELPKLRETVRQWMNPDR